MIDYTAGDFKKAGLRDDHFEQWLKRFRVHLKDYMVGNMVICNNTDDKTKAGLHTSLLSAT